MSYLGPTSHENLATDQALTVGEVVMVAARNAPTTDLTGEP